jgi:hypothetical protein
MTETKSALKHRKKAMRSLLRTIAAIDALMEAYQTARKEFALREQQKFAELELTPVEDQLTKTGS